MKKNLSLLGLAVALFSPAGLLFGQVVQSFDENGGGGPAPFLGVVLDPSTGLMTVAYALPGVTVTPGDLLLTEPLGVNSDLIRFIQNGAAGPGNITAYFYSLNNDGIDSLA